jgi:LPXTG-motif cell wall-anchored protein
MTPIAWITVVAGLTLALPALAEPLWLSEVKPGPAAAGRGHGGGEHNHGGPVEGGRGGAVSKRLWLREGESYRHAPPTAVTATLLDPKQQVSAPRLKPEDHGSIAFPMPDEGYYNLYLVGEAEENGRRTVSVAKAEVLRHSCRNGHDHVAPLVPPNAWDGAPLDIIRERLGGENFHTLLGSGDTIGFRILAQGRPAAGARVTMHTAEGWSRTVTADGDGRARFQLIRDYYPDWELFDRRYREGFRIEARYDQPDAAYVASYAGAYHPSARDYASYSHGLLAGLAGLTLAGGGVLLRRRKRKRVVL